MGVYVSLPGKAAQGGGSPSDYRPPPECLQNVYISCKGKMPSPLLKKQKKMSLKVLKYKVFSFIVSLQLLDGANGLS
jgi:hypothetical protein